MIKSSRAARRKHSDWKDHGSGIISQGSDLASPLYVAAQLEKVVGRARVYSASWPLELTLDHDDFMLCMLMPLNRSIVFEEELIYTSRSFASKQTCDRQMLISHGYRTDRKVVATEEI